MTTDSFCFHLQNRLIQTSQTGVQWYSDTSPFSIPWYYTHSSANMHCNGTACIRLFGTGLTSAEDKRLECFEWRANIIFMSTMHFYKAHMWLNHAGICHTQALPTFILAMWANPRYVTCIGKGLTRELLSNRSLPYRSTLQVLHSRVGSWT